MSINRKLESELTFKIGHSLLHAVRAFCKEHDITEGSLIRNLIEEFLGDDAFDQTPDLDSATISECKVIIESLLACSTSWADLQSSLRDHGIEYYERGGGLAVRRTIDMTRICKASEVGPGYSGLIKKFGEGFPGHRAQWIADRVLSQGTTQKPDN